MVFVVILVGCEFMEVINFYIGSCNIILVGVGMEIFFVVFYCIIG